MLHPLLIQEFKRRVFEESYMRIFKCVDMLSDDQLWHRPNEHTNSVGNLILHLHGNMRQWMMTSFARDEDVRMRSEEFKIENSIPKKALLALLLDLKEDLEELMDNISERDLENDYKVQVYIENGVSILVHVIEHFSYHTGQIALLTKLICDKDLEFYPYSLE